MTNQPRDIAASLAYRWRQDALAPVENVHTVPPEALLGIDRQKQALLANTAAFVSGRPANHALLTGARGTGKSTLVKAMLTAFSDRALRLVAVSPHDLVALPEVVAPLRNREERFLLYVDDFSVARGDPALTALKTALDGGIEAPPENVLIYATSNRRHLMPELRGDNDEYRWQDGELHPGETVEETISLSERFGLWLSFPAFNQEQYLMLVDHHLATFGLAMDDAARTHALRWALQRASRSGRVAQQFARHWAGSHGS